MSQADKTFYITTPIYYPSAKPHIGHSYTTVAADTIVRYKKLRGYDTMFLTGTDEHGQKIETVAKQNGVSPKEYVDKIFEIFLELWELLDIEYDIIIRTTDDYHKKAVQKIFKKLHDQGDIYKSLYEGNYCTPCETFFTERQIEDGKCPDCGRETKKVKEESYFFRLSKYQDRIMKHLDENPEFIMPVSRRNEMINNFLKPGLEDLCVSRTSFKWGIPVDFDPSHVVYVWLDALTNYTNALGFMSDEDEKFKKYWPADVHLVGKEIVRFHSIIWPAILMALGEEIPKQVFGHGWIIIDGNKMSKSQGTVVDPKILVNKYGVDAVRYFLLREFNFGIDGNFTNEALIKRINADLANDLGNLLSRTVGMIDKYFDGELPAEQRSTEFDIEIIEMSLKTIENVEIMMDKMAFHEALAEIWNFIRRVNKYTDETQPWVLVKDCNNKPILANVLYNLTESLRIISVLISPFMPNTAPIIQAQLNMKDASILTWEKIKEFGLLKKNIKIEKGDIVFPRIDIKKELEELEKMIAEQKDKAKDESPKKEVSGTEKAEGIITIQDFSKIKLLMGEVIACEKVEGSDKLLKSQVKIGNETRQIVSGIAAHYTPEEMVGKKIVVVANLKPTKLRGVLSEGMLLAASDNDGDLNLVTVDGQIGHGAEVR